MFLLLVIGIAAQAAKLKVLSAIAMMPVMEELGPRFERATGHKLVITSATLGAAVKRVQGGEAFDVVIIPRPGIDGFVKEGRADGGTVTVLARSSVGVAVRKGAPKPDLSSPETFRRALLAARAITYSNPAHGGPIGIHFARVLERLGIGEQMKSKTVFLPRAGAVGVLVANGEAEIAVGQIQELVPVAGIEVVGPLPADLQDTVVFSAAVMAGAREAGAGKALIEFLRAPQAAAVIKAKGMEPAAP